MRTLLLIAGITAVVVPVLARPKLTASASTASTQAAAGTQAQAPGGGNPVGVLGPVDALGQEVKRPPAPTSPPPRLPDGTIELGDGLWVGALRAHPAVGLRAARSCRFSLQRKHSWHRGSRQMTLSTGACPWACCGIGRIRSGSSRTTRTRRQPTCTSCPKPCERSARSSWMAESTRPSSIRPGSAIRSGGTEGHAGHRYRRVQRQVVVRQPRHAAHRAAAYGRAMDANRSRPSRPR